MTDERYHQLNDWTTPNTSLLTLEEKNQGWHFCWEWDGLLVGPVKDSEWGANPEKCLCGLDNPNPNKSWIPK